jgi:hypothetical protein
MSESPPPRLGRVYELVICSLIYPFLSGMALAGNEIQRIHTTGG